MREGLTWPLQRRGTEHRPRFLKRLRELNSSKVMSRELKLKNKKNDFDFDKNNN